MTTCLIRRDLRYIYVYINVLTYLLITKNKNVNIYVLRRKYMYMYMDFMCQYSQNKYDCGDNKRGRYSKNNDTLIYRGKYECEYSYMKT
jgi:hypothetical protein